MNSSIERAVNPAPRIKAPAVGAMAVDMYRWRLLEVARTVLLQGEMTMVGKAP